LTDMVPPISELRRAFSMVIAIHGHYAPVCIILLAVGFWALSIWLLIHIIKTQNSVHVLSVPLFFLICCSLYFSMWVIYTFWLRKLLYEVVIFCLRLPLRFVVRLYRSLAVGMLVFFSKCAVVRKPRYRDYSSGESEQRVLNRDLCRVCNNWISKSRLLTGSSLIFNIASPIERWSHPQRSLGELRESALSCHLCSLFCHSIGPKTSNFSEALKLKVWEERSLQVPGPKLMIQMHGSCAQASKPLRVQEIYGTVEGR
jgi:hypothetical protein